MTKNQRQLFLAKVKELILSLGAEEQGDDFILQTRAGLLTLHLDENGTIGLGTVFSRFDDPLTAVQLVDCNRFSGKWNFHFFDGWTVKAAVDDLSVRLKTVFRVGIEKQLGFW